MTVLLHESLAFLLIACMACDCTVLRLVMGIHVSRDNREHVPAAGVASLVTILLNPSGSGGGSCTRGECHAPSKAQLLCPNECERGAEYLSVVDVNGC